MNKRTSLRKLIGIFNHKEYSYKHQLINYFKSQPKTRYETLSKFFIKHSEAFMTYQKRRCFKKWTTKIPKRISTVIGKLKNIFAKRIEHTLFKI